MEDALKRAILLLSIFIKESDLAKFLDIPRAYVSHAKNQAWETLTGEEKLKVIVWAFKSWRRVMNFLSNISRKLDLNIGTIVDFYYKGIWDPLLEKLDGEFKLRDWSRRTKILRGF